MNRREFINKLIPATAGAIAAASLPVGATTVHKDDKVVFVYDPNRLSRMAALETARSLGVPKGTMLVAVYCSEGQTLESAFALMEKAG